MLDVVKGWGSEWGLQVHLPTCTALLLADHRSGHHFIIPEMADSSLDLSELAKAAKKKLQAVSHSLYSSRIPIFCGTTEIYTFCSDSDMRAYSSPSAPFCHGPFGALHVYYAHTDSPQNAVQCFSYSPSASLINTSYRVSAGLENKESLEFEKIKSTPGISLKIVRLA